ncbi:hypothetical protein [Hallella colorans]|uniref:hypothetical protein n=1 Tax=Hallella colorans TaxID=1703337 RepID=UPI000E303A80|nr:hypothetical protein [Hallella colorans]
MYKTAKTYAIAIAHRFWASQTPFYDLIHAMITDGYWASMAYAALFVSPRAPMGNTLWRQRLYIKL